MPTFTPTRFDDRLIVTASNLDAFLKDGSIEGGLGLNVLRLETNADLSHFSLTNIQQLELAAGVSVAFSVQQFADLLNSAYDSYGSFKLLGDAPSGGLRKPQSRC
jgi:hypothetical protein